MTMFRKRLLFKIQIRAHNNRIIENGEQTAEASKTRKKQRRKYLECEWSAKNPQDGKKTINKQS